MAKQSYKIPSSIDSSFLDIEIALRGDSGMGIRPLPMKLILACMASLLMWYWAIQATPIGTFGIPFIVAFTLVWLIVSVLFLRLDKSGGLMIARLPILFTYIPRSARKVSCRTDDNAGPFYSIAQIDEVDEERGIIKFADGDVGLLFRVVGSGSVLLFDDDREAVLDRVDNFYKNMRTDYEIIYITAKEAQNVRRQVRNMDVRRQRLVGDDPELMALANMERDFLTEFVGKEFRSIHQYVILKARNIEALTVARNLLQSEIEGSSLMFKRCAAVYDDDLHAVFRSIYKGRESL